MSSKKSGNKKMFSEKIKPNKNKQAAIPTKKVTIK